MNIPRRDDAAQGASSIVSTLDRNLTKLREDQFVEQITNYGNVPDFMRNFIDIELVDGDDVLIISVSPDVLCIGSDDDYLRVPGMPQTYQLICDTFGCVLPTKKISDIVWQHASTKLSPYALPAGAAMTTTDYYTRHNDLIQKQLEHDSNFVLGNLVAGHKKDVVITNALAHKPDRVAIYGWHFTNGQAIQGPMPNSSSHELTYADYSHSLRMVDENCRLNGQEVKIVDILQDQKYSKFISDEGPMTFLRYSY